MSESVAPYTVTPLDPLPMAADLAHAEAEAARLVPQDEPTEQAAILFIGRCKSAVKSLDDERRTKTDPLREQIERIAAPYKLAIEAFKRLQTMVEQRLSDYRLRLERERAEAQRRAIEAAERARLEAEQKAAQARALAEAARAAGDERAAAKAEAQAARAELKAAAAVAPVIEVPAKTLRIGDTTATLRKVRDWTFASGLPRGQAYYRDDPRFRDLPDHVWKLDEAKIGALIRAGASIPGVQVVERVSTVNRGGQP